ncbi:hypothetical protein L6452_03373 [Arctium lappa]|uniref:Uncharacterized protein n=1 Tax=Arctium lappa TaxID=4217 RepID=A0ACB9FM70_ARCLA|nr:hypothetical protein L6452_03373 [Arctium lappa]
MIRVSIKTTYMVKPAERTCTRKLPLSELDKTSIFGHIPTFYFYTQSPNNWIVVLQTLKSSLSCTLVHFFLLADLLSALVGGRLELDCNVAGVQFVEAYVDKKLIDLYTFLPSLIYHQLIPSIDYHNTPLEEIPFAFHFVCEWTMTSRGELLESLPYLDKKVLRAGDPPWAISSTCKACNHKPEQPTALATPIDVRSKMRSPLPRKYFVNALPRKYFGNDVINVIVTGCADEIVSKPLGYSSSKIRDAIERVDDDYVKSVIDFLKIREFLSKF